MRVCLWLLTVSAALAQTPNGVNLYSVPKEIELGKQLAADALTTLRAQPDARLQAIGDKLAAKTDGVYQYTLFVYSSLNPQFEPIALPGGAIFIARNMITADGAETAAVLAHAIAHIALRHYSRGMARSEAAGRGMAQITPSALAIMRINQQFDFEADQFAVKLLLAAGYDPEALLHWLESFPVSGAALRFGDRPAPSRRVAAVQRALQDLQ